MTDLFHERADGDPGTPVTTETGGPSTFDQVVPGSGALTYRDDVPLEDLGNYYETSTVGGSGTPHGRWIPAAPISDRPVWFRWYQRLPTLPPSNLTTFRTSELDGTGGTTVRYRPATGTVDLLNSTFGLEWSSAYQPAAGDWFRCELEVNVPAGTAELRLWHGANLHGDTPDESSGPIVGSFGDGVLEARFGHGSNVAETVLGYDELAVSDQGWIGAAVPIPPPLYPWEDLAEAVAAQIAVDIAEGLELPWDAVNVYPTPTEHVVTPAVIIGPSIPWIEPDTACEFGLQRYLAIVAVSVGESSDALKHLYEIADSVRRGARRTSEGSGSWETTDPPRTSELGGHPHMIVDVRLAYRR